MKSKIFSFSILLFIALLYIIPKSNLSVVEVKGAVYDELGTPLVGVLINEQRSQKSTISEIDGSFLINVSNENAILEFTSVGYEKRLFLWIKKIFCNR